MISGQRYLFHEKAPYMENKIMFRANFVSIIGKTLIINSSETERNKNTLVSIPIDWITKIETLENILDENPILPSDILLMIDEYL
jgi:hypothetical protein